MLTDAGRELAKAIDANWFVQAPVGESRILPKWSFENSIGAMTSACLHLLFQLHLARIGVDTAPSPTATNFEDIRRGDPVKLASITVSIPDLVATMKLIALSEYRIGDFLYYPPDLRELAVDDVALAAGVARKELLAFDADWHRRLRLLVYSNGGAR